ncbi:hypothetical protein AZF37_05245 [endosymbiont 'TC1' of Trimyema compressum]|uniref:Ig-like domain-containing protein n=1 Tax=endosymbiont 'TC1' of Trimyema compressum TaxID=243899 RepID=UPI0007F0A267|nr:Ig-like domain-containing protein [endosymbiont 'TC1' of Trimyema compressum]AMP20663.1 hypothetical protein AZF37_05245 [endosymbiont 'TC1' of Trimyema compressum]
MPTTTSVNFSFKQTISIGSASAPFSGNVVQPLVYTTRALSFDLNGGNGSLPGTQILALGGISNICT